MSSALCNLTCLIDDDHVLARFVRSPILVVALYPIVIGLSFKTPEVHGPQSLRSAAEKSGLLIGTAVRPEHLSEGAYASTLAYEFNMVEPEDCLKWEIVHPQKDRFDFSKGDQIVEFAAAHNLKVRGHTLLWHRQNPQWLTEGRYTSKEMAKILEDHIKTVVGHYRGKIFAWDVVNEAFDETHDARLRSTIWREQAGIESDARSGPSDRSRKPAKPYDFIEQALRWAHEADPQALLFYNEAEAEQINAKSDAILAMVSDFRRRGVPIDGIGFQMHIGNLQPDVASIAANLKRFTSLGLQVHITEMDVALAINESGEAKREDLETQATVYRQIAEACLTAPGCTAIQTWGFTDKYSWIGSHSKNTKGAALLFDKNYHAKPAYEALQKAIQMRSISSHVGH